MRTRFSKILLIIVLTISVFAPHLIFANGGDQRIVEGTYYINFSRAPFTPRVGVETSMIASFVDIEKDKLIAEELIVKVRVAQLGGAGKREFLFEKDNLIVQGGVLELAYTFTETGLHEIFFDFAFASDPQRIYEAPDFLLDIQKAPDQLKTVWLYVSLGVVSGIILGWLIGRKSFYALFRNWFFN